MSIFGGVETAAFLVAAAVVVVIAIKFEVIPWIYDVRLTARGIEFVLFSCMPVYVLTRENIEEIIETRGGYKYLFAYNFKNRFFQRCFLIRKKKGLFTRTVLITPPNPSLFVDRLAQDGIFVK